MKNYLIVNTSLVFLSIIGALFLLPATTYAQNTDVPEVTLEAAKCNNVDDAVRCIAGAHSGWKGNQNLATSVDSNNQVQFIVRWVITPDPNRQALYCTGKSPRAGARLDDGRNWDGDKDKAGGMEVLQKQTYIGPLTVGLDVLISCENEVGDSIGDEMIVGIDIPGDGIDLDPSTTPPKWNWFTIQKLNPLPSGPIINYTPLNGSYVNGGTTFGPLNFSSGDEIRFKWDADSDGPYEGSCVGVGSWMKGYVGHDIGFRGTLDDLGRGRLHGPVYNYTISCRDDGGRRSHTVRIEVPPTIGPFSLTATPGCQSSNSITKIDWGSSTNATRYDIQREDNGSGPFVTVASISDTGQSNYSYPADIVIAGRSYRYQIIAVNEVFPSSPPATAGPTASITALNCATPTVNLTVNLTPGPLSVPLGSPYTLTWSSSNANRCNATTAGPAITWSGLKALSGSKVIPPPPAPVGTYTHTLTCTNLASSLSASRSVTVNVTPPVPPTPPSINPGPCMDPSNIDGRNIDISWTSLGITGVEISKNSAFSPYYQKAVLDVFNTPGVGFTDSGTGLPLPYTTNTSYYVRVYDGINRSAFTLFTTKNNACGGSGGPTILLDVNRCYTNATWGPVTVTITDPDGVDPLKVQFIVTPKPGQVFPGTKISATDYRGDIPVSSLTPLPGSNTLEVDAYDLLGNKGSVFGTPSYSPLDCLKPFFSTTGGDVHSNGNISQ